PSRLRLISGRTCSAGKRRTRRPAVSRGSLAREERGGRMRALALRDQRRRRPTQMILGAAIAISSGMSAGSAGAAETVAATVSGLPFAPRVEHSLRVGTHGASIRFQAPRTGRLSVVHTLWRRSGRGCHVALHAPAIGAGIGPALVSAPVPDDT